jgi:beta-mannanase
VGVNGNAAEDLVAAWRHVRGRFDRAGAGNVRWVWCPDAGLRETPLEDLYPGDDAVDWVALDGYNWGDVRPESGWRSFEEIFGDAYDALGRLTDRPLMVAETASTELGGDKAAWIAEAFAALPKRFPRVRALSWFGEATAGADWPLTSSPEAVAAFGAAVAGPRMWGRLP